MTQWLLDFLSNLSAGLATGAISGACAAAVAFWRTRRIGALTGAPSSAPATLERDVRVLVSIDKLEVHTGSASTEGRATSSGQASRTVTQTEDNSQWIAFLLVAVFAVVGLTYLYFRYQDVILLTSTFTSSLLISATVVFLVIVGRRGVQVAGVLVVQGCVALVASATFLVDLYLLFRAGQSAAQQQLVEDAQAGFSVFVARHGLLELLPVAYQLLGFVLSLMTVVLCLWAALGLLARIWWGLSLAAGRRSARAVTWLAETGPRGVAYVVMVTVFATLSLLLTSGVGYSLVESQTRQIRPDAAHTVLTTSIKKLDDTNVRLCGRLASTGTPLSEQTLLLEALEDGDWTQVGKPQLSDKAGQACAKVKRSSPTRQLRWTYPGTAAYAMSTSDVRRI